MEMEHSQEIRKEDKKTNNSAKSIILETILWLCIALACIFFVPRYVMQRTIVSGYSMEDTLHDADNLIVEKVTKNFKAYDRFDIVIFYPEHLPEGSSDDYYVKRVIGLPGETVQIIGERIYINGEVLEESYGKESIDYAGIAADPVSLGEDEYFVLGDNRRNSQDSRYEEVGIVHKSSIAGKAILRIWPLNKFGLIK